MLTTVILTHDSVETLSQTLASVSWSDEILLLDDSTSDAVQTMSQDYTARVIKRHLVNDFSAQRNTGLQEAKGDWVLFVDSDEVVPDALKKEILEKISRKGDSREGIVGYYLRRDDIFLGKKLRYGETQHVKFLRLAQKNAGVWIRPVHEVWDVHGPTQTLTTPLIHYAHTNVAQFITAINRYTTMSARYLYDHGVHSGLWAIIAYPVGKFFQNYLWRRGFLDGTAGFVMAMMMSFHSFLVRAKLYLLWTKDLPAGRQDNEHGKK